MKLSDPEVEFKVHLLCKPGSSRHTLLLGFQKIQSRKKSFESFTQWIGSYINDVVKKLASEVNFKQSSESSKKENVESEV